MFDHSRYQFCATHKDREDRLFLEDREPFRYRAFADNRVHVVTAGETLFTIAGRHFKSVRRGAGLWWVIADFQPVPLHDPTIQLPPGQLLVLPSMRTVMTWVLRSPTSAVRGLL